MLSTPYRPDFFDVLEDHEITRFCRRELGDPNVFAFYCKPSKYFGIAKWIKSQPGEPPRMMRELLSIGTSLDQFTFEKVKLLKQKANFNPAEAAKEVASAAKAELQERQDDNDEMARIRAYSARATRAHVAHPMWQPDSPRLSFG